MKNTKLLIAPLLCMMVVAGPAMADSMEQIADAVQIERVNVTTVATGFRSSKIVGGTVTNDANETIGKVDDVIVSPDGKTPFVILAVGGFLGLGSRLVAVPFASLHISTKGIVLPGGTKDELKALPEFRYAAS